MKYKKESCKYCGEKLDAKTTRAEFCSPKCKVYWHRENPKVQLKNFNKQSMGTTKDYTKKAAQNETINTVSDPKEGSIAFYLKYDCYSYSELEKLKQNAK